MRGKVRRLAAAGGIAVATLPAVGGGLAANLVTSAEHWPRPLEWLRTHPRELLELALVDYESRYGPEGFNVATILRNLANLLLDEGRAAEAVPLLRRALKIDTAAFGADHPRTARNATLPASAVEAARPILAVASRKPPVRGNGQSPPGA